MSLGPNLEVWTRRLVNYLWHTVLWLYWWGLSCSSSVLKHNFELRFSCLGNTWAIQHLHKCHVAKCKSPYWSSCLSLNHVSLVAITAYSNNNQPHPEKYALAGLNLLCCRLCLARWCSEVIFRIPLFILWWLAKPACKPGSAVAFPCRQIRTHKHSWGSDEARLSHTK